MAFEGAPAIVAAVNAHAARIKRDALIVKMDAGAGEFDTEIEGYPFAITITKA